MEVNMEAVKKLLEEQFNNNQTLFAQSLGLERTHVNKILKNNGKGAGALFYGALINFCNENKLNYKDYIFLSQSVNKFTKNKTNHDLNKSRKESKNK